MSDPIHRVKIDMTRFDSSNSPYFDIVYAKNGEYIKVNDQYIQYLKNNNIHTIWIDIIRYKRDIMVIKQAMAFESNNELDMDELVSPVICRLKYTIGDDSFENTFSKLHYDLIYLESLFMHNHQTHAQDRTIIA